MQWFEKVSAPLPDFLFTVRDLKLNFGSAAGQ